MQLVTIAALCVFLTVSEVTVPAQTEKTPPPIALVGGTLIDVANSGRVKNDIHHSVVILRGGRIEKAGPADLVQIPKDIKQLDCTGTYILPGLVDGFAGLNSQAQANAWLYMGVTTIVGSQDDRRGMLKLDAHPGPHIYPLDSAGLTDDYNLLTSIPQWRDKLRESNSYTELSDSETKAEIRETARRGTRVIWLGHSLTTAKTKLIIEESHRLGLITYGEFTATPYSEGIKDGIDVLLHMSRYPLGVIPFSLQISMMKDPEGEGQKSAYAYLRKLDVTDASIAMYGSQINAFRVALMPTFSLSYLLLPDHRNLWKEPASVILDARGIHEAPDPVTGEAKFPSDEARDQAIADATHFWGISRTLQTAHPMYLAASGASARGTMPGISMHTELELLVRLGLTPREALAAGTSNYSERLGWHELGLVETGRRADLLILGADPTISISNTRDIRTVILGGAIVDRAELLQRAAQ